MQFEIKIYAVKIHFVDAPPRYGFIIRFSAVNTTTIQGPRIPCDVPFLIIMIVLVFLIHLSVVTIYLYI